VQSVKRFITNATASSVTVLKSVPLWKYWRINPLGWVFVRPTHPRAIGVSKVNICTRPGGYLFMSGKFQPVIKGDGMYLVWVSLHVRYRGLHQYICLLPVELDDYRKQALGLSQGQQCPVVAFAYHGVTFPATYSTAGFNDLWMPVNSYPVLKLTPPVLLAIPLAIRLGGNPQMLVQSTARRFVGVNPLVNHFVVELYLFVPTKVSQHLLRSPPLSYQTRHRCHRFGCQFTGFVCLFTPRCRQPMRLLGSIVP
jgi:hypothetical protein